MIKLLYLFYFFSGTTALIYEIIWARRLGLIFGVDAYGIATVLSVFFIGLALGSYLFGRFLDSARIGKKQHPPALFWYGALELGIGGYAAITPLIFKYLTNLQTFLFSALGNPEIFSFSLIVFLLSILALLIPTILMGATWPAVTKAISLNSPNSDSHLIGISAGLLYGFNTLGAVTGTILAGFLLVWLVGTNAATWLAAAVNLIIGSAAMYLSSKYFFERKRDQVQSVNLQAHQDILKSSILNRKSLLVILFLTGFAALALEVLWTRVLIITFGTSTYAFAAVLATFLLGIALGSLIAAKFIKRHLETFFSLLLTALGLLVVLLTPILGSLPIFILGFFDPQNTSFWQNITASVAASSFVILLPTLLMGSAFTVALKIYLADSGKIAKDTGTLYAINTIGGVLGAFIAGFIFLPFLGAQRGIAAAALIYLLAAITIAFSIRTKKLLRVITVATASLVIILGIFLPSWNKHLLNSGLAVYYQDLLSDSPQEFTKSVSAGEILYYKEAPLATVMVKRTPEGSLFLRSNGKTDASTDQDLDNFKLLGHLPMILHPNPQKTLLVGIGSGISAGAMAAHKPQALEIVEIEQAMVEAARYFGQYNREVVDNPNVNIIQADARAYLQSKQDQYDVIASQPSNPWVRGNANLFTKEFFQIAKNSLKDEGLMMQWVQFYSFKNDDFKAVLKTFSQTFPYVTVWTPVVSQDILLVGSKNPQEFNFERIDKLVKSEAVQQDFNSSAITSGETLLAHYMFDQDELNDLAGSATILSDNKPTIEFTTPFSLNRQTLAENLSLLLSSNGDYAKHLKIQDQADQEQINKAREAVTTLLEAKIKAQNGQVEAAAQDFEKALAVLPKELAKKELASFYFELAHQASKVNDIPKMTSYFEKSTQSYPNANIYLNLAILYLSQNRLAKATEALEEAKKLQPDNPRIVEVEKTINDRRYR